MGYSIQGELLIILGMLIYFIFLVVNILKRRKRNIKFNWGMEFVKVCFVFYILLLAGVTLMPIEIGFGYGSEFFRIAINLIPFKDIIREVSTVGVAYRGDTAFHIRLILRNVGGNLILLLPLGIMLPIIWKQSTQLKRVLLLGSIVSISIELLQLIEMLLGITIARAVDIDDVILNVLGVLIGYAIYKGIFYLSNKFNIKFMLKILEGNIEESHMGESAQHKLIEDN